LNGARRTANFRALHDLLAPRRKRKLWSRTPLVPLGT